VHFDPTFYQLYCVMVRDVQIFIFLSFYASV